MSLLSYNSYEFSVPLAGGIFIRNYVLYLQLDLGTRTDAALEVGIFLGGCEDLRQQCPDCTPTTLCGFWQW